MSNNLPLFGFLTPQWILTQTNGVTFTADELWDFIVKFNNRQLNYMISELTHNYSKLYNSSFKEKKLNLIRDFLFQSQDNKLLIEYKYMMEIGLIV
jgi:hypothetical protein